jgi:HAD superfamily hydrolase (TIGR01509 family)
MGALIFDFDGVIADSEALANLVLAEFVTELGSPTTLDEALVRYSGRRWAEVVSEIEGHVGRAVSADFGADVATATLARFRSDLREVEGASEFIRAFQLIPRCIASSSSPERLQVSLEVLGLAEMFGDRVFSAEMVKRGKPHPDLFLLAANRLGAHPCACLVIEDSVSGIVAASNAGMVSVGLCAASHVRSGHAARLRDAGATFCASSWQEVHEIAADFFGGR